jgi:hypothetical protein
MPLVLVQLMKWNDNPITEHNRKVLNIDPEEIARESRMANATKRKYYIARKKSFSVSWDMLPKNVSFAVDGAWAGGAIESFYNSTFGPFELELTNIDATTETYQVMFSDFSKEIVKRGTQDFWNISVTMEEV